MHALLLLASCTLSAAAVAQGIVGSRHDFGAAAWNPTREYCAPCHVPHSKGRGGPIVKPLWNHELSTATYALYASPSLRATPEQPRGASRLCLGCHDGTVALEAFGGRTGYTMIGGSARIGTNLTAEHPVSIRWTHNGVGDCFACHFVHGQLTAPPVPFPDGRVECTTCHEPHDRTPANPGGEHMLRLPVERSALCLVCHDK